MYGPANPAASGQPYVVLSGDGILASGDNHIDPASPRRESLRRLLQARPWAIVVALDRWIPTLLALTTRHLDLCIGGAVLIDTQDQRLPLLPLPYPTVILTDQPAAASGQARSWGSLVVRRDPALPEAKNLQRALGMLQPAPCPGMTKTHRPRPIGRTRP